MTALTPLRFAGVLQRRRPGTPERERHGAGRGERADAGRPRRRSIAAAARSPWPGWPREPAVVAETGRIRQELTDRGLLLARWQRRRIVRDRLILAAFGVAAVVFVVVRIGLLAVPGLIALAVGHGRCWSCCSSGPAGPTPARRLLRQVISAEARLDPAGAPDWSELTPSSMAAGGRRLRHDRAHAGRSRVRRGGPDRGTAHRRDQPVLGRRRGRRRRRPATGAATSPRPGFAGLTDRRVCVRVDNGGNLRG